MQEVIGPFGRGRRSLVLRGVGRQAGNKRVPDALNGRSDGQLSPLHGIFKLGNPGIKARCGAQCPLQSLIHERPHPAKLLGPAGVARVGIPRRQVPLGLCRHHPLCSRR